MTLSIAAAEPRGYLATAMRIAGVAAVLFPLSMVLFTSLFTGAPTHRWLWLFMLTGMAWGAAMGLTFAAFLRGETRSVTRFPKHRRKRGYPHGGRRAAKRVQRCVARHPCEIAGGSSTRSRRAARSSPSGRRHRRASLWTTDRRWMGGRARCDDVTRLCARPAKGLGA